jgi:hypothetical protein
MTVSNVTNSLLLNIFLAYFWNNFHAIDYDNDRLITITATNIKEENNNKNNEYIEPDGPNSYSWYLISW